MVRRVHVQSDWMTGIDLIDTAAHEWLGLIAYRLTGKIDELFPSPKPTILKQSCTSRLLKNSAAFANEA